MVSEFVKKVGIFAVIEAGCLRCYGLRVHLISPMIWKNLLVTIKLATELCDSND